MSLVQTLTSVQEQTLTAVPRLVVVFRRDDGDAAVDGASAGEFHAAFVYRLSQVSGIGRHESTKLAD